MIVKAQKMFPLYHKTCWSGAGCKIALWHVMFPAQLAVNGGWKPTFYSKNQQCLVGSCAWNDCAMGNLVSFLEERLRNGVLDSKLVAGHLEVNLFRLGNDDVMNGMWLCHVLKHDLWGEQAQPFLLAHAACNRKLLFGNYALEFLCR